MPIEFHKTTDGQLLDQNGHRFAWFGWQARRGYSLNLSTKDRDVYLTLVAAAPDMRRALDRVRSSMRAAIFAQAGMGGMSMPDYAPHNPRCGWCSGTEDNHEAVCLYAEVTRALARAEGRG